MATMLINDMPDEVHAELLAEAQRNHRPVEKQALLLIKLGLRKSMAEPDLEARAARIRAQCQRPVTLAEIFEATKVEHR